MSREQSNARMAFDTDTKDFLWDDGSAQVSETNVHSSAAITQVEDPPISREQPVRAICDFVAGDASRCLACGIFIHSR